MAEVRNDSIRNERAVYIISVAAELAGVHPQTLRIYERKGLLHPARTRGNTRRYSERDIERLQQIQRLTQDGVNLAGVKMIMDMEHRLEELRSRMAALEEGMRERVAEVHRQYRAELVPLSDAPSPDRVRGPDGRIRERVRGASTSSDGTAGPRVGRDGTY